jgi:flagellar basal-body rod protein FlgG
MESLEMLANNLANAATGGYKSDQEFYSLYLAPEAADSWGYQPPATAPVIERQWTDFSQGLLRETGNPLDVALSGRGFLAVDGPSGPLYSRNGNLRLSTSGQLVTAEGYPLRTVEQRPIQARADRPLDFGSDGSVRQDGQVLGRLELADFADPSLLVKVGHSYFRAQDPNAAPRPASGVEVHQRNLESSNVGTAGAAVRLVSVMRQFEMLQKAISLGGEMNRRAIEEVARVG